MNSIKISSFKGFAESITLETQGKNVLLYGENGSGKSSLYEAIRMFFYKEILVKNVIKEGQAAEVREAEIENYLNTFNNIVKNTPFSITVNNLEVGDTAFSNYRCFMLSNLEIDIPMSISVERFLETHYLGILDTSAFLKAKGTELLQNVNNCIRDVFKENFMLEFADTYYTLRVHDTIRGHRVEKNYRRYFNEAKLHLIVLLLFFETIKLIKDDSLKNILVLDDIVTSLDATNRIFLVNYIMDSFEDMQKIVMTHNVSFFNLFHFKIGQGLDDIEDNWLELNIYESNGDCKYYQYKGLLTAAQISERRKPGAVAPLNDEDAGNLIRRRFEAVMYEYAKLVQIDAFEESGIVLSRLIDKGKNIYIYRKNKNEIYDSNDLLDVIRQIIAGGNSDNQKIADITNEISKYINTTTMPEIKKTLKTLKMFQKVVMHQLSHGTEAMQTFSAKEIEESLALLSKFEILVKKFKDGNAYGF